MTYNEMRDLFSKYNDEFLEFENIPDSRKLSKRADLNAFLLLDNLLSSSESTENIISAATHDEYYLSIDVEELARFITEEDIKDLLRCGIRYDSSYDCLARFT